MTDPSMSARVSVLEAKLEQAQEDVRTLTERREESIRRAHEIQAELDTIRARAQGKVKGEDVRDVLTRMGTFTLNELATELGVPQGKIKKHIEAYMTSGMVKELSFRAFGKKCYEYVRPTEAGPEFEAQRRLELVRPTPEAQAMATAVLPQRGQAVAGAGRQGIEAIANKDIRKAVRDAMAQGWTLSELKGNGHWNLVKTLGGVTYKVGVAGTPKNPTAAAERIRRLVQGYERGAA